MRKRAGTCGFAFVSLLAIVFSMFKANIASAYSLEDASVLLRFEKHARIDSSVHATIPVFDLSDFNTLLEDGEELDDEGDDSEHGHEFDLFVGDHFQFARHFSSDYSTVVLANFQELAGIPALPIYIRFRNLRL